MQTQAISELKRERTFRVCNEERPVRGVNVQALYCDETDMTHDPMTKIKPRAGTTTIAHQVPNRK